MKVAAPTARDLLASLPPAVSGAGGHNATLRFACECVRLGLGDAEAMDRLREYSARCSPPWSEKELAHKLQDARRKAGGQLRAFIRQAPSVRVEWKLERSASPPPTIAPSPRAEFDTPEADADQPADVAPVAPAPFDPPNFDDDDALHLAGWLDGRPVYRGTRGQWRASCRDAVRKHQRRLNR